MPWLNTRSILLHSLFNSFQCQFKLVSVNVWFFSSSRYTLSFNHNYGLIRSRIFILFPYNCYRLPARMTLSKPLLWIIKIYSQFTSIFVIFIICTNIPFHVLQNVIQFYYILIISYIIYILTSHLSIGAYVLFTNQAVSIIIFYLRKIYSG